MSADEEIRRVFTLTWGMGNNTSMTVGEVSRSWSLDHQWMTPSVAEEAVSALISTGWLIHLDGLIEPCIEIGELEIPLGWWPNPEILLKPPRNETKSVNEKEIVKFDDTIEKQIPSKNTDTISRKENRLLRFIAQQSGLPREEILRRSQRKQRSLGPATLWICILLVAKEQGIDIQNTIQKS